MKQKESTTSSQPRKINYHPVYPECWNPKEKGEEIQGIIYSIGERQMKDDLVPYLELLSSDTGDVIQVIMSNAALSELIDQGVCEPENYIAIRYDGLSKTVKKSGNFMKLFSAYVEGKDGDLLYPKPSNLKPQTKKSQYNEALEKARETSYEITDEIDSVL